MFYIVNNNGDFYDGDVSFREKNAAKAYGTVGDAQLEILDVFQYSEGKRLYVEDSDGNTVSSVRR